MTEPEPRTVRLILDTSAIIAFTRGSINVGEVLAEIDDCGGAAALPLACLIAAAPAAADMDRLDLLVAHPATVVIADEPDLWRPLVSMCEIVGRADAASAALAAIDYGVEVLTRQPGLYSVLNAGDLTITIED